MNDSSEWRTTARASDRRSRGAPLAYARCADIRIGSANVSEAAASRNRKSVRPIRAANHIYFAREENVLRKVTDADDSPHISSRNSTANQKTKIVSSALDICSRSA